MIKNYGQDAENFADGIELAIELAIRNKKPYKSLPF
jgi:hypothetical protein